MVADGEVHEEGRRLARKGWSNMPAWEMLLEEEPVTAPRPLKRIGQDEVFCGEEGAESVGYCEGRIPPAIDDEFRSRRGGGVRQREI